MRAPSLCNLGGQRLIFSLNYMVLVLVLSAWQDVLAKDVATGNEFLKSLGPMHTHCVGRYLIDLPEVFELSTEGRAELIFGLDNKFQSAIVQVPASSGEERSYRSLVQQRLGELKREYSFKSTSKNMLAFAREVEPGVDIIRSYESPDSVRYFRSRLYALKGSATVFIEKESFARDRPEDIEAQLLRINRRITVTDSVSKAGPGSCLGPAVIDAAQDGEKINVFWQNKRWPDFSFTIYINSMLAESDGGLLARFNRKLGDLSKIGAKFDYIRRGKLTIAGRPAEELLTEGIEYGKVERQFKAEVLVTVPSSFTAPFITFEMLMGGAKDAEGEVLDPSLTQEQGLALWDAVLKSVRLRPGAVTSVAPAR